jgi:uncharacterized membrane protein YbhN (UPF0104 family)
MKKISIKSIASIAVLLLTSWWIYYYLSSHHELLSSLGNISLAQVVILITLRTLYTGTYGLFLKMFAEKFAIHLKPVEWFGLPFITTMGNQLTPFAGGVIVRALYLKHRHSLPYTTFTTLLVANHLMIIWVAGLIGLLTCVVSRSLGPASWLLTIFFFIVVGVITLLVLLPPYSFKGQNIIIRNVNIFLEGWSFIKNDKTLLIMVSLVAVAGLVLNGFSFWLAYHSIDFKAHPAAIILVSLLPFFLVLFYITPGNFGIQEIAISLTSGFVGPGVGKGLLVALLVRATTIFPVFILGPIFCYLLTRNLGRLRLGSPDVNTSNYVRSHQFLLRYLFKIDKDK